MADFGEMLAELRQDANLTQKELADKLFVSKGTVSNYENGVHYPDIDKLIALADLFGVSTDYLLGRSHSALPVDVLEEAVLDNKTAGQLVAEIRSLSPERKRALSAILRDMTTGMFIDTRNNG